MELDLRFSDKEITAWGGMAVMKRMLEHLKFDAALMACGLPQPGSNRGYRPEQLVIQFMLAVWCGANRFEHGEVTRHDPVLKRLFGFKRMANFKAVIRLFNKFGQSTNESVMDVLYRWMFDHHQRNYAGSGFHGDDSIRCATGRGAGLQPCQTWTCEPSSADGFCGRYAHDCQLLAASGQQ